MLILFIGSLVLLFYRDPKLVENIINTYGLVGIFLVAIAVNATVLFPLPIFDLAIFFLSAAATDPTMPFFIGLATGAGAAIGELSGYFVGLIGIKAVEQMTGKNFARLDQLKEILKRRGALFVYLGAVIPFPFDLVSISAGLIKFNLPVFFMAALLGKITRFVIFSYAGYYGIQLVTNLFLH